MCAMCEDLRLSPRMERSKKAVHLVKHLDVPDLSFIPSCKSTDVWRHVIRPLPEYTKVFNTAMRCPTMIYFVCRRGESILDARNEAQNDRLDPSATVSEYLQHKFGVAKNENLVLSLSSIQDMDDDAIEVVFNADRIKFRHPERRRPVLLRSCDKLLHKNSALDHAKLPLQSVPILSGTGKSRSFILSQDSGHSLFEGEFSSSLQIGGGIDKNSLNRAKDIIWDGETWAERSLRMIREAGSCGGQAQSADGSVFDVIPVVVKSHDDLRQEMFVMQMIHYYKSVFFKAGLPLWLKTYRILSTSKTTGLLEYLVDCTNMKSLYRHDKFPRKGGLRAYFEMVYGDPTRKSFLVAQRNFMHSCAGYSLVSYLLGIKDRHDGNIMLDIEGRLLHIDFGYVFGMTLGGDSGVLNLERAPFKLTQDYINVMGGIHSDCFKEFKRLFVEGFMAARENFQIALGLVEIMMFKSNFPCFVERGGRIYGGGNKALEGFEKRMMLHLDDDDLVRENAGKLVDRSIGSCYTSVYDWSSVQLDKFMDTFHVNLPF